MPVFDTGPIDNRINSRTEALSIRISNTGRRYAIAGIEVYQVTPSGDGFSTKTLYAVELVSLAPFANNGDTFTADNIFANLDTFGVRVLTSGLGGNEIAVAVLEKDANGQIIRQHILEGEFTDVDELLFVYAASVFTTRISVMETATNQQAGIIETDRTPSAIAITPDGTLAYVPTADGTIDIFSTKTNSLVNSVPLSTFAFSIAFTPDGSRYYCITSNDTVTGFLTATNTIVASIALPAGSNPSSLAITPNGLFVYVATAANDEVKVISTITNMIVATVNLPAGSIPINLAITPDSSRVYVANTGNGTITVIETAMNSIVQTFNLPGGVTTGEFIAMTPDGSRFIVLNTPFPGEVTLFNLSTNTAAGFLSGGVIRFNAAVMSPDGTRAYLTSRMGPFDSGIFVIDLASFTITAKLPVISGTGPVAITPILLF